MFRASIEALNRGDLDVVVGFCRDDVEIKRVDGVPEHGLLHGKAALRSFLEPNAPAACDSGPSRDRAQIDTGR